MDDEAAGWFEGTIFGKEYVRAGASGVGGAEKREVTSGVGGAEKRECKSE